MPARCIDDLSMNSESPEPHPAEQPASPNGEEVKFHGWRLLGFILLVCVVLAGISALVDYLVIGPLEGRI